MTTTDRQPVLPDDLGRFAEIGEVVLSRDGTRVAVAVSLPDVAANRYRRDVLTGPVDSTAPLTPHGPQGTVRLPYGSDLHYDTSRARTPRLARRASFG